MPRFFSATHVVFSSRPFLESSDRRETPPSSWVGFAQRDVLRMVSLRGSLFAAGSKSSSRLAREAEGCTFSVLKRTSTTLSFVGSSPYVVVVVVVVEFAHVVIDFRRRRRC